MHLLAFEARRIGNLPTWSLASSRSAMRMDISPAGSSDSRDHVRAKNGEAVESNMPHQKHIMQT